MLEKSLLWIIEGEGWGIFLMMDILDEQIMMFEQLAFGRIPIQEV